jgi:hypothetical protein
MQAPAKTDDALSVVLQPQSLTLFRLVMRAAEIGKRLELEEQEEAHCETIAGQHRAVSDGTVVPNANQSHNEDVNVGEKR